MDIVCYFAESIRANIMADGHPCERCDQSMHGHDWVDLDPNGFVVYCSWADAERLYA